MRGVHAAMHDRHLVPRAARRVDDVPSDELRPAEDEELHRAMLPQNRSVRIGVAIT